MNRLSIIIFIWDRRKSFGAHPEILGLSLNGTSMVVIDYPLKTSLFWSASSMMPFFTFKILQATVHPACKNGLTYQEAPFAKSKDFSNNQFSPPSILNISWAYLGSICRFTQKIPTVTKYFLFDNEKDFFPSVGGSRNKSEPQ